MTTKKLTTEEFIKRAINAHGNEYDYSETIYVNKRKKVNIVCKIHGHFEQFPQSHIKYGCKKCGIIKAGLSLRITNEEFIKRSITVHGNKYDYSLVECNGSDKNVLIICPHHGVFEQRVSGHLRGYGCKMCNGNFDGKYHGVATVVSYYKNLSSIGVECRGNKDDKNILEVRCHKCGKWYIPDLKNVINKVASAKGTLKYGHNNLYCSDDCKGKCKEFNFNSKSIDFESILYIDKSEQCFVRKCQTGNLKQIQCDEKGYNYCERCGDIIDVELHHTLEIVKHGNDAINSSGHVLLCAGCHVKVHSTCN